MQTVTPELRAWVREQIAAGYSAQVVAQSMVGNGWQPEVARAALEELLPTPPSGPGPALPAVTVVQGAWADGGDRRVGVAAQLNHPVVTVLQGLLSEAECDALVDAARPRMARSETVRNLDGGTEVNPARTSQGMFFSRGESALIQRIEARIAHLLKWPVSHGEGLQVLHYTPGAEYKPHFDYFDPAVPGSGPILKRGGQRLGTLVMYLNTPEAGGATTFPDVGFQVLPVKGNAVFFSYDRPHPSTGTLHGGAPVTAGDKWVATKWLREGVFN